MKHFFYCLSILLFTNSFNNKQLVAQNTQSLNAAEILQAIERLNTVGSVLYVAAHPDDENTRLLAYLSKERKLRTGYLSLTRGDGGQNLIGKEQGDALGLIRTEELLAARRVDGAEQFFTRANDFGFSKNPEETLKIWDKDSVLADVVWRIRKFKPDVIICRFPTTGEGGHGHHTASAMLALEAFDAAADSKRFPEQLTYVEPWQATRIFWNTFNFGSTNTTSPDQLKINVGLFNPLIGKEYGEIAAESRSMHKSQGFGSAKARGEIVEYFKYLKGNSSASTDLFDGIDQSWKRIKNAAKLQELIESCIKNFDVRHPQNSLKALAEIHKGIEQLNDKDAYSGYWKALKLKETENLMLACAGVWMEAAATDYVGIPGNSVNMNVQLIKRNDAAVTLNKIHWTFSADTIMALALKQNELYSYKHNQVLLPSMGYSDPYWLKQPHEVGLYHVTNQQQIGLPENEPALVIGFDLEIEGVNIKKENPLVYKYTDPVKGEIYRPFEVLPPVTVNVTEKVYVFNGREPKAVKFIIKTNEAETDGVLQVNVPEGWKITIDKPEFKLKAKGDEITISTIVYPGNNSGRLKASVKTKGKEYSKSISRIEYDHIPYQFMLSEAEVGVISMNVQKAGSNIGYIPGAGDEIPACLQQLGYTVTELTDDRLSNSDLSKYNAIVTGVRAYNTNERLQVHYDKLMDYVNKGGNLVVQYNTNNKIGPLVAKIGPYPFTISRDRVTDETAEVRVVNPTHAALNYPNKIDNEDFIGWKQERGIYFATELDKNYETIFSMNDPSEKASEGSLIITKYGQGNFVYTGIVFFRELPAGVPGAYKLFANLLSLPSNKK